MSLVLGTGETAHLFTIPWYWGMLLNFAKFNTQKKFWSQKVVSNVNQSLFEPQYESTKCDWQFLLAPGLTINIKNNPHFCFE